MEHRKRCPRWRKVQLCPVNTKLGMVPKKNLNFLHAFAHTNKCLFLNPLFSGDMGNPPLPDSLCITNYERRSSVISVFIFAAHVKHVQGHFAKKIK